MDWQDELRRLDKQLSEGEISAQDYRRMRDELLAEASAPAQGRGALWSGAHPEAAPAPAPAPPPAPPSPDAEDTQIVADSTVVVEETVVAAQEPAADETVVHASPVEQTTVQDPPPAPPLAGPGEDPDRTATVAAETVAESDTGRNARRESDTEAAARKQQTPTFPPRPADGPIPKAPPLPAPAPWTGQVLGEEVFADAKAQSNARRAATMLLSLVVVLAVIGGAVWFFVFRSDDAPAAEQSSNPPATEKPNSQAPQKPPQKPTTSVPQPSRTNLPTNLADALGPLPGAADKNSGSISPARAGQLKLVAPQEVKAADDQGVTNVIFRGATNGDIGSALLVFATPNGTSALNLAKAERGYLGDSGFVPGKELRSGLPVLERRGEAGTVYRVVYTTGKYTVRFGVAQRDASPVQLRKELESVADTILAVLPPS
jgi:hypothetical protein